jgi:hypothetical protein
VPAPRRGFPRDAEGLIHVEVFLVSAVATVLATRAFLALAGWPRLGGGGLHVAHMLWGGLGLATALIAVLVTLGRGPRTPAATLGGAGFGLFIDEVGKFVTRDHDYFYRPAVALMYGVFVLLFFAAQRALKGRALTDDERLANAVHLYGDVAARDLDTGERARALALLDACDPADPRVAPLRALVAAAAPTGAGRPGPYARLKDLARRAARYAVSHPALPLALLALLAAQALAATWAAARLGAEVWSVWRDPARALGFGPGLRAWAELACAAVAGGHGLTGAAGRLLGRGDAWRHFRRALLVTLFGTQFFRFHDAQFAALAGLAANLALLAAVESARRRAPVAAGPMPAPRGPAGAPRTPRLTSSGRPSPGDPA